MTEPVFQAAAASAAPVQPQQQHQGKRVSRQFTQEDFDRADDVELLELLRPSKRHRAVRSESEDAPEAAESDKGATGPVQIGGKEFVCLDDVRKYLNGQVLSSIMPGNEVEGEAAAVLLAVFEHHPKHAEKLAGQTLSCFVVKEVNISRKPGAQQLQKCFWVRRSDGSEDDFSVNRCLEAMKGVPSAEMHLQDVLGALLNAVYPHLRWFKGFRLKKYPLSTCPYSGEELTGANSIAVNEFPLTNAKLIKEWLQKQGVKLEDIKVRSAEAGSPFTKTLASKSLLKAWKAFYAASAKLVLVSRSGYRAHVIDQSLSKMTMD